MSVSRSIAVALFAAVASSQCGGGGSTAGTTPVSQSISPAPANSPGAIQVRIAAYKYIPETLTVSVGQVVRWTNEDNIGHTVTFTAADTGPKKPITSRAQLLELNRPQQLYSSRLFALNESWSAKFDRPGRYAYICDPHPYMKAVVIVQ